MANSLPTLVLIPGAWHRPTCYDKMAKVLREKHKLRCVAVTLPSASDNPEATFKDDIDAAREAVSSEVSQGRDVVVVAHSYGGMVGNSVIKGFARPKSSQPSNDNAAAVTDASEGQENSPTAKTTPGHVIGIVLIASGFTLTGVAFMDPFFGHPPPAWRVNAATGFAELAQPARELFYHDVEPREEADFWVSQLRAHSLKSLFEGGEHAYAGWLDRMQIGMARVLGGDVVHREMRTSHSPFLSRPTETAALVAEAVEAFSRQVVEGLPAGTADGQPRPVRETAVLAPLAEPRLWQPLTWLRFGLPLTFGRFVGSRFPPDPYS
ncbi:unnamed protein product [Parascedosporium putredinis]|uniref:AB hydrolase-1 domain-containing protein n=1 Tax=Parascedosporium putredinis TaxID=1442378 RepID=A0A9P1HDK7_9PEZI|nr:unnamed protein product [Parascedosporium putredinis]CAI8004140.1 unnamed protein product [Parascedosporium putredinis]